MDQLQRMVQRVQTPEGVPRLFDLITVRDDVLKLAFFVNLQNTVVAKDIDQVGRRPGDSGLFPLCCRRPRLT